MPEFRKDPIVDRWVIISTERAKRPQYQGTRNPPAETGPCPFCTGNEAMTPPEVLAYRSDKGHVDSPGWTIRVVPNKYPALGSEGNRDSPTGALYQGKSGLGAHEVIVESPQHLVDAGMLSERQLADVLRAYRERMLALQTDQRWHYVLIYKNQGAEAGATLEHVHSQLIALPAVPREPREEIIGARAYYQSEGRCIYCDILRRDAANNERAVAESEHFFVICPFASRFPYETWILPKQHEAFFERSAEQYMDLSRCLRETLIRIDRRLENPSLNYLIHSNPINQAENGCYHWHMEILPKLTQVAGFEWGSGLYINPVPPEDAARSLRDALP